MFNVLNNLVSLARKKSDKMEPALLQLSTLLRYMLYEGNDSRITIAQEISYLQGYINLQKLRFGDDVEVQFSATGETGDFVLEPMILIPFVENAFKHAFDHSAEKRGELDIYIRRAEDSLVCTITDNGQPLSDETKVIQREYPSFGLALTKKRLERTAGINKSPVKLDVNHSANGTRVKLVFRGW